MFAISERVRPCSDLWFVSSEARFTLSVLSPCSTLMPSGTLCASSPLGPLTFTVFPSTVTVTPAGMETGIFPIRDMVVVSLPDDGHELAAGACLSRCPVRHHALVGARGRDPERA